MVTGDSPSATLDLVRTEGFEEVLHVENETGNRGGGRGLASVVAKRGAVAALVCAAVIALVSSGAWDGLWELFSERDIIRRFVEDAGLLAPAAYVLLLLLQAVFAPLPAPAVAVAGGYVFGITEGFFLTWAGALLGGRPVSGSRGLLAGGSCPKAGEWRRSTPTRKSTEHSRSSSSGSCP